MPPHNPPVYEILELDPFEEFEEEFEEDGDQDNEKEGSPKKSVDLILDIVLSNQKMFRNVLYHQQFEQIKFKDNADYQGKLSTVTEYWYNTPKPRKQEYPIFRNGELTFTYEDPVEKPIIHFYRFFFLELDTGNILRFALFGSTEISETIDPKDVISIADLERFMGETDKPHIFSGVDTIDFAGMEGFNLEVADMSLPQLSVNEALLEMGLDDLSKVQMTAKEQYDFMTKLIEARPDLDGWLRDNIDPKKIEVGTKSKARQITRWAKNSIVTEEEDKILVQIVGIDDLAHFANQLREDGEEESAGEKPLEIKYQGQIITASELKELFFTSIENAVLAPDGEKLTNVLIYEIEQGYLGRKILSTEKAQEFWRKLDKVGNPEDLNSWNVKEKFGTKWNGKFRFLDAAGIYQAHRIDVNYYRGRQFLTKNKERLNQGWFNDINDDDVLGYTELRISNGTEGENFRIYVRGELDRPASDAGYFRSILNTWGYDLFYANSFQFELGQKIFREVNEFAKEYAHKLVYNVAVFLDELGKSRSVLESQLLTLPDKSNEERQNIITSFGYEHDALNTITRLFSDKFKTSQIILGLEVDGYTIDDIIDRIQESASEMIDFSSDIYNDRVDPIGLEGDFGNDVRRYAYEKIGFHKLDPTKFPHHDEAQSSYTYTTALSFTNTREQLYADYIHTIEKWKKIGLIILVVIVGVVLALASAGVGLYVAGVVGATGWGAVAVTGVVGGIVFTILSESLMQLVGQGTLNRDKDWFGLDEFFIQMFWNVVVFTAFGVIGKVLGPLSFVARLTAMGFVFFTYGLVNFILENDRLPEGYEWYFFILENLLAFVLFEIGLRISKGTFTRIMSSGYSKYARRMTTRLVEVQGKILKSQKSIAEIASGENKSPEYQVRVTEEYIKNLKELESLLKKYEKKSDTGWRLTNEEGAELSKTEVAEQRKEIKELIRGLEQGLYLKKTGSTQIIGSENVISYNGTAESAKMIKKQHKGQGHKVHGPGKDGILVVEKPNGETLQYVPDTGEGSIKLQESLISNTELGSSMRRVTANIMAVEEANLPELKEQFREGTWVEVTKGELYSGEKMVDGKNVKLFFLVEGKLSVANAAYRAEGKQEGTGLDLIKANLRGEDAIAGYKYLVDNKWKIYSDGEKVKEFWKLEQKGKKEGESLNTILEKQGRKARAEEQRLRKEQLLKEKKQLEEEQKFEEEKILDEEQLLEREPVPEEEQNIKEEKGQKEEEIIEEEEVLEEEEVIEEEEVLEEEVIEEEEVLEEEEILEDKINEDKKDEDTKTDLVDLTEETFNQAAFEEMVKGPEKIGPYTIYGTKGLVGDTFNRNIFYIVAPESERGLASFRKLINHMEAEALSKGASKISIFGSSVINKGFLNPTIARRFGYSFEQTGDNVFLQKTLK